MTGSDYARFKGEGTINDQGAYKFMIWAGDGTVSDGADTFRIKIWWEDDAGEHVVYDNGMDQAIGGGNIAVHTSKKVIPRQQNERGRLECGKDFPYGREWNGKHYLSRPHRHLFFRGTSES